MPACEPAGPPQEDTVHTGPGQQQILAELLTLTWEFLSQASPAVRDDLRAFLTSRGYHPQASLGWFLDTLQLSATRLPADGASPDPPPGS
jgi:hypothetical protein